MQFTKWAIPPAGLALGISTTSSGLPPRISMLATLFVSTFSPPLPPSHQGGFSCLMYLRNDYPFDHAVFEYNPQFHNVMQVTHDEFQSCNGTSAIASYTSGSDSVTLKRPGHFYFLCGVPGHCQAGQKVDVLVKSSSKAPIASPSPSALGSSPANPPSEMLGAPGPAQSSALSLISSKTSLVAVGVLGFAFYF